ncbi:transmembrane channel-like protein 5 isoform X3 [Acropora millepora]|uniref:transmembrane channel-like protein 5 isoform X3 n=1 Tax=Acropora millepora TaxID=45264 RepID=UPI001CF3BADB|nr:transmembrane channel-like protein 5 isoform X3 [Acropora millepora]
MDRTSDSNLEESLIQPATYDDEQSTELVDSNPSLSARALKQRALSKMSEQNRTKGQIYQALNVEEEDDEDDEGNGLREAENATEIEEPRRRRKEVEPLSTRLKKLRHSRSFTLPPHALSSFTALKLTIAMEFKNRYSEVKEYLNSYELWRQPFKEIEGSFGNGVLSYFTFLKWLLLLNIYVFTLTLSFVIIPQALSTGEGLPLESPENVSAHGKITNATSLFEMMGSQTETVYVRQRRDIKSNETVPWGTIETCHLVRPDDDYTDKPITQLVMDFISGVGWINTTLMFYGSYSDKVLVIGGRRTYYNMPLAYFMVGCVCFLVILLSILWSASQIFEESYVKEGSSYYHSYANKVFGGWDMCIEDETAAKLQFMRIVKDIETSQGDVDVNSSAKTDFIHLLKSYASPITLSVLGAAVPTLFFFLSCLEDWNPRTQVNVVLFRTVLLKLASVGVLLVSLYNRINQSCMLCWENVIGAEMYKLIWTEFFVSLLVIFFVQTPRRYFADHTIIGRKLIGRPTFSIPDNVLELVYAQSLIWIGTWYSPFIPIMAIIKLPIVFYAKKATVSHNCRSQEKAYLAGRSNYFFMILLLGTFLLCLAAVAYGITQIRPSYLYGPFRGLNNVYDIIPWTTSHLPSLLRSAFNVICSPVFLVVLGVIVCLGLYFFYAIAKVYRKMIRGLRQELIMASRDKKELLRIFSSPPINEDQT